jgi:hypothetical protein
VSVYHDLDQRWRLLVPLDVVVVTAATPRADALAQLRALPSGTPVAVVGVPRPGWLAARGRVKVHRRYVVLPSVGTPVAITQLDRGALAWMARTVLTVPSGVTRLHAPVWAAVRVVRALPRLLRLAPASHRILVGTRS